MKLKKINNWFARVLLVCFLALVWIGGLCEHPYHTNPNLRLLVGDTIYWSTHNFNPVVSIDGNSVYYLSMSIDNWSGFYEEQVGSIYSVNIDGGNVNHILPGMFNCLAISADGRKLAVQSYKKGEYFLEPESLIVIVHLDFSTVDSLWISTKAKIMKMAWSSNDDYLYFLLPTEIRRLSLSDSLEETVMLVSDVVGFDLFKNDSIHIDSNIYYSEIDPLHQKYILGTADIFANKLLMRSIQKDTILTLPDSLLPFLSSWVGQPYWVPNSQTIVFSAAEQGGGAPGGDPAQIWILENIFEQIEE